MPITSRPTTFGRSAAGPLAAVTASLLLMVPTGASAAPTQGAPQAPTRASVSHAAMAAAAAPTRQQLVFGSDSSTGVLDAMMQFGYVGERAVAGDWNGDGVDGVVLRRGATYYLKNNLSTGEAGARITFGTASDQLLVGDWNGDGKDTLALRRGTEFLIRNTNAQGAPVTTRLRWGRAGDRVLVGDWNGDGKDTLALRRGTTFLYRNSLSSGPASTTVDFGRPTDSPLSGDWNGDGHDSISLRRGSALIVRNTSSGATSTVTWGRAGEPLLVGDWDADGKDFLGAARSYDLRYAVWEQTNAQRAKYGRSALKYSNCLQTEYSQPWSSQMAATGKFEHQTLGRGRCTSDALAENIAAGYGTPSAVMSGWMNSSGHRANILATGRRVMGVGVATTTRSSDPYKIYWTQNFG